jgi:serine/threonine protein kinase
MVLEYMDCGSLDFFLHIRQNIEEHVLAAIVYQILWGLGYLHYEHKLHRDIKPANVLFVSNNLRFN